VYNLGARNSSFQEFFDDLSAASGIAGPWSVTSHVPHILQDWTGIVSQAVGLTAGSLVPLLDPVLVEMSRHYWYIDSSAAQDEGIFRPRDHVETIVDTVRDLRELERNDRS